MQTTFYLDKFEEAADRLDRELLIRTRVECKVGVWLHSVALKMQKRSWINPSPKPMTFGESIFFGIWLNDESIREGKLNYNIHALKLRELTGYSIRSREFAAAFRSRFKPFEKKWPNIRLDFGPLTLMQGSVSVDTKNFGHEALDLANKFLEIHFIIDDLLEERKK